MECIVMRMVKKNKLILEIAYDSSEIELEKKLSRTVSRKEGGIHTVI